MTKDNRDHINNYKNQDRLKPINIKSISDIVDKFQRQYGYKTLSEKLSRRFLVGMKMPGQGQKPMEGTIKIVDMSDIEVQNWDEKDILSRYIEKNFNITRPHIRNGAKPYVLKGLGDKSELSMEFDKEGNPLFLRKTPSDQEYIQSHVDAFDKASLNYSDKLNRFQSGSFTLNNISKIFVGGGKEKSTQGKLLQPIIDLFVENPNEYSKLYPITVIDDIDDLKNYGINAYQSIGVDFTEVLGPIALLTNNVRLISNKKENTKLILDFLGVGSYGELNNVTRPATIHYGVASNTSLYDSFIEYKGKVLGISSKANKPQAGASITGLRKAILEVQRNPEAARRFNQQINNNSGPNNKSEVRKMFETIVELIDVSMVNMEKEKENDNKKSILKLNRNLNMLNRINPEYTNVFKNNDIKFFTELLSKKKTTALNSDITWVVKPLVINNEEISLSNYFKSQLSTQQDNAWKNLQSLIIGEIVDDLNENPLFSSICTWLLNHSAVVQVDTITEAPKSGEPLQIYDMTATWPSTVYDRVTLVKDKFSFYISINGFKEAFPDFNPISNGLYDIDMDSTKQQDEKSEWEEWRKGPMGSDDWILQGQIIGKAKIEPGGYKKIGNTKIPQSSQTSVYELISRYSELIPSMYDEYMKENNRENALTILSNRIIDNFKSPRDRDDLINIYSEYSKNIYEVIKDKMAEQIKNWWNSDLTVSDVKNMRDYRANAIRNILSNLSKVGNDKSVTKEKLENLYYILAGSNLPIKRQDNNTKPIEDKFLEFLQNNLNYRIPKASTGGVFQQNILINIYSLINRNSNIDKTFVENLQSLVTDLTGSEKQLIRDLSKREEYNVGQMTEMAKTGNIVTNYIWPIAALYYATKFHFSPSEENGNGIINALIEMNKLVEFSTSEIRISDLIFKRIKNSQPKLADKIEGLISTKDDLPDSVKNSIPESRSAILKGILAAL